MSTIYHKHHIVPRHMGGTDDPSNLIELTIQEHAEAHRKLFEEYGRWQDEVAWKFLSKQITLAEVIKETQRKSNLGKPKSELTKKRMSEAKLGHKNNFYGRTHSEESRLKISLAKTGKNHPMYGKSVSEETRRKISEAKKKKVLGSSIVI